MAGFELIGKGVTGRLTVNDHFVTIYRKGVLAKANHGFTKGEKRIAIAGITAVQYKKPGVLNGYIQFTLGGGDEGTRGAVQAAKDENSVVFNSRHVKEFERIRDHVEQVIIRRSGGSAPAAVGGFTSVAQDLKTLADLRDQGVISDQELADQKQRLLGVTSTSPIAVTTAANVVAGWYPDPNGVATYRYWDGWQWTSHTA